MKIGKKFLIYLFCGLLTFSVVSSSYYKTVHAFEYVGGALAFEEALKWLLACLGITATAGMTDAYWETYGDDFTNYAIQNGATQQEVAEWQLKACEGVLDKGSEVWTKFKTWASGLISGGSGDVSVPALGDNCFSYYTYICNLMDTNYPTSFSSSDIPCYGFFIYLPANSNEPLVLLCPNPNDNISVGNYSSVGFKVVGYVAQYGYNGSYTSYSDYYAYWRTNWTMNKFRTNYYYNSNFGQLTGDIYYYGNVSFGSTYFPSDHVHHIEGGENENTNFDTLDGVNTNDLDVISSDGVNESDDETAIPYPGVSDSDNTLSNDAYQDIVDKINDGTITQEQGIEQIQELLRVITYDTVTDEVVPPQKNDDGTNKTKDDALKENKENAGFTLAGLENVFPFCIPFDIYAFMTLLVAEPETPEFDFPIKTVNGHQETIHVDLEPFEPVAVVVRYVFDFLFIVGLAMLTRSLIGGGSSD